MNVLICAMDAPGLAYQAIGLARAIEARGHRAACVASAALAAMFRTHEVERIPRPGRDGPSFSLARWDSVEATQLQLLHLRHAAHVWSPDVIVASPFGFGPALAARALGLPLVVIGGLTFLWSPGSWRYDDGWRAYRASCAVLGLDAGSLDDADSFPPWLGMRYLLQSAPSLTGPHRWPRIEWVGDCSWDPPAEDAELLAWIDAARRSGRRIAYVQIGREFGRQDVFELLADASAKLELAFIVATGHSDHEQSRTSEWLWARPFAPRGNVLPHAAIAIGSGHPTTVLGALVHGVPQVLLWSGSGTEEAAAACHARGVALTAPLAGITPRGLTTLLASALANRDLVRASAELGAELRARGGLDTAAEAALRRP